MEERDSNWIPPGRGRKREQEFTSPALSKIREARERYLRDWMEEASREEGGEVLSIEGERGFFVLKVVKQLLAGEQGQGRVGER